MYVIRGRNVHSILPSAMDRLMSLGVERESRNGPVRMFPEPVTTVYERPEERVIFYPERDTNPFFHLAESLWMLGGRNDVAFVARYVKQMAEYSDDGVTIHDAYGHRWRNHFIRNSDAKLDQLTIIIEALRKNPDDRRLVLAMWDPTTDLGLPGKAFPCNTQATFQVNSTGQLDMTVMNRSNDMVWGAYGANAVHFSVLLEYMARSIGVPVGRYYQISANFHTYLNKLGKVAEMDYYPDPYAQREVRVYPLMDPPQAETLEGNRMLWEEDLEVYLNPRTGRVYFYNHSFFPRVAEPLRNSYFAHKAGDRASALAFLKDMPEDNDWRRAAQEWLERRYNKDGAK